MWVLFCKSLGMEIFSWGWEVVIFHLLKLKVIPFNSSSKLQLLKKKPSERGFTKIISLNTKIRESALIAAGLLFHQVHYYLYTEPGIALEHHRMWPSTPPPHTHTIQTTKQSWHTIQTTAAWRWSSDCTTHLLFAHLLSLYLLSLLPVS